VVGGGGLELGLTFDLPDVILTASASSPPEDPGPPMTVVLNWLGALKK